MSHGLPTGILITFE